MSWPGTDFEVGIQNEINALRDLERTVKAFLAASARGPHTEVFRNLRRAHEAYEEVEPAEI